MDGYACMLLKVLGCMYYAVHQFIIPHSIWRRIETRRLPPERPVHLPDSPCHPHFHRRCDCSKQPLSHSLYPGYSCRNNHQRVAATQFLCLITNSQVCLQAEFNAELRFAEGSLYVFDCVEPNESSGLLHFSGVEDDRPVTQFASWAQSLKERAG